MAKKKKAIKKIENRGRPRKAPAPRLITKAKPPELGRATATKPATAAVPAPSSAAKPATTSIPPTTGTPELVWIRVLGHWVRKDELAKGCEWYDDGGNEGLKQRPIS